MLKSFYLAGFKSFGEPVEIDLSKITLLYGENSSGKSSVLQALQYAREVFCNQNLDCLSTELGGDYVDLRGFDNFVHGRDPEQCVTLGFKFLVEKQIPGLVRVDDAAGHVEYNHAFLPHHQSVVNSLSCHHREQSDSSVRLLENPNPIAYLPWGNDSKSYEILVRFQIGQLPCTRELGCLRVAIIVNGVEVVTQATLKTIKQDRRLPEPDAEDFTVFRFNLSHPSLPDKFPDIVGIQNIDNVVNFRQEYREWLESHPDATEIMERYSTEAKVDLTEQETSECGWKTRLTELSGKTLLSFVVEGSALDLTHPLSPHKWLAVPSWLEAPRDQDLPARAVYEDPFGGYRYGQFTRKLTETDIKDLNLAGLYGGSMILHGWGLVASHLQQLQYVGPLRRHYEPPRNLLSTDTTRSWADGLGGWDTLAKYPEICDSVNYWMTSKELFNFDCRVETSTARRDQLKALLSEIDEETAEQISKLFEEMNSQMQVYLRSESGQRLTSRDVGVGYSQLLPIVVAAKAPSSYSKGEIVMLEQPELHIHVRLQAVLADLLASSDKQFLVETHSEALLLRLMRRIRETSREIINNGPRLLNDSVSIYHIRKEGKQSVAKQIKLDSLGNLTDEWPDELFEISFRERFGE